MSESGVLLTYEDRALLMKVSDLFEEIIETFDILGEKDTMRSIREVGRRYEGRKSQGPMSFLRS